jgi:hypothetical protein
MRHNILLAAILSFAFCMNLSANHNCEDWKKRVQNEKIAYLSTELDMTSKEAQNFWPVYNTIEKEKDQAMHQVFKTYFEMKKAIEDGKSEKEILTLLNKYLAAQDNQKAVEKKAVEEYLKVLPASKVAKIFVSEENFRRDHIRKLHHKGNDKPKN